MKFIFLSAALLFNVTAFAHSYSIQQTDFISPSMTDGIKLTDSTGNQYETTEEDIAHAQLTLINNEIKSARKKLDDFNSVFRTATTTLNTINSEVYNYRESVLQYAGALLNIPYSDFIITEIAIPIFKNELEDTGKNPKLETTFTLLQNYKANTTELKNILQGYKASLKSITGEGYPEWAVKTYVDFKYLPLVKQYKTAFPATWGKTYLGAIINRLEEQLQFNDENAQKNTSELLEVLIKLL